MHGTMTGVSTFEERLRAARDGAGMAQVDVAFEARTQLPKPMWISQAKLQRLESGKIGEANADPFDVGFLAHLYGVTTEDLSPLAEERLTSIRALVGEMLDSAL